MYGIQNRITNLIPMIIALFEVEFPMEESSSKSRYLLRYKSTGNFFLFCIDNLIGVPKFV